NELRQQPGSSVLPEFVRELQSIEKELRNVEVPFEEWQVLSRGKLLVERGLLLMEAGITPAPPEPAELRPEKMGATLIANAKEAEVGGWLVKLGTGATLAVLAIFGFRNPQYQRPSHR